MFLIDLILTSLEILEFAFDPYGLLSHVRVLVYCVECVHASAGV